MSVLPTLELQVSAMECGFQADEALDVAETFVACSEWPRRSVMRAAITMSRERYPDDRKLAGEVALWLIGVRESRPD